MVQIKAIWWRRFKWLYALVLVIAAVIAGMMAFNTADTYHQDVDEHGQASRQAYRDMYQHQKPDLSYRQFHFQYSAIYISGKELQVADMPEDDPITKSIMPVQARGMTVDSGLIIVATLLGAFFVAWDHVSGFERFMFGLGAARRRYYAWRTLGLAGLVTAGTLVHLGGYLLGLYALIPSATVNLHAVQLFAMLGYSWLVALAGGMIGQLIGLVVSHWLAVALTTGFVMLAGFVSVSNYSSLLADQFHWFSGISLRSPIFGYWFVVIGAVVVAVLAAWWGQHLYAQLSYAVSGWLRVPKMMWPCTVIAAVLVVGASIQFNQYGYWDIRSLIVPFLVAIVAAAVAWWHKRMQRA